ERKLNLEIRIDDAARQLAARRGRRRRMVLRRGTAAADRADSARAGAARGARQQQQDGTATKAGRHEAFLYTDVLRDFNSSWPNQDVAIHQRTTVSGIVGRL